jgi:lipoate-protein ligase B
MSLNVRVLGRVAYADALRLQEALVQAKLDGDWTDDLLIVEHESVYTLGRGADPADLSGADRALGIEAIRVGRGGGVTYHGPGQVVAYPIMHMERFDRDVRRFVRALEAVLIGTCAAFGVRATSGVAAGAWVEDRKIGSVGIAVRRWVGFHGIALNVSTDLGFFSRITPCRIPGLRMTSLEAEGGVGIRWDDVADVVASEFLGVYSGAVREIPSERTP